MLFNILAVLAGVCIVGLLVWVRCRLSTIPPNAQLLCDVWASVEGEDPHRPEKPRHAMFCVLH